VKVATRIALLQWQANPADPANFMRLVVAWLTPGMREATDPDGAPDRPKPDRPSQSALPGFIAAAFCAIVVVGIAVMVWFWSRSMPARSAQDQALYDYCLVQQAGNTIACDAWMRIVARGLAHERAFEAALYQQAGQLRAAGFSDCEIERWAASNTEAVGSELSKASGIPLNEIQAGKCNSTEVPQKVQPAGADKGGAR
jgi:hypothetical protein